MFFSNAGWWWLALTVPAILALYILRPRRKQVQVPSTLLWRAVAADLEASKPWQRLQSRLLLWLQLLAAVLLVLAAMGPVWLARASSRDTIVLLDTSASMKAREGDRTRFDQARQEVEDLAAGLRGGSTITVIAFDRQPRVLVRDGSDQREVRLALQNITPSAAEGNVGQALTLAQALARHHDKPRLVLVSDGGVRLPAGTAATFEFIHVGKGDASIAIGSINLRPAGNGQAAQVTVVNLGSQEASGVVSLMTGNYPAGSKKFKLPPGQVQYLLWPDLPAGVSVSAELKPDLPEMDLLELDNRAWAVPEQKAKRKILLVTGGNIFLERALGLLPNSEVYTADAARYRLLTDGEYPYDLTVLDGLSGPLPPGAALLLDPPAGKPVPGLTVGASTGQVELSAVQDSPLVKYVDLAGVNTGNARTLQAGSDWHPDIKSGNNNLFVHGEVEGKRMAFWSVNLHRSDLPLRPAFPVLLQNTVDWLVPPSLGAPGQVRPGDEVGIVSPFPATSIVVKAQGGAAEEIAPPFPPSPWVPGEPGLYRVIAYREGGSSVHEIAVNGYSSMESDLKVSDPRQAAGGTGSGEKQNEQARRPLALMKLLALAALLLIMVEWGVASRGR
ncbi:vWA domain-containing protein [Desulfotruncus alcoholivorax]|uniref:vWA domain-containing protein n=1 Tax=Desulfotruncus alcoholivorax TaxID=265477 RepID=UPI000421F026|nr:BatA and WFA domain-containing protein [Desulfotruncus alcoholivorax]